MSSKGLQSVPVPRDPKEWLASAGHSVESKLMDVDGRLVRLELRAMGAIGPLDSWVKRNGDWVSFIALAVGVMFGHFVWR